MIINYDSVWRRPELLNLKDFTLILDESQYVKNNTSKRTKFVMKLKPTNIILLSGTPCSGRYEELLTQCKLLGWNITKSEYWDNFIHYRTIYNAGIPIKLVTGYKNIDILKSKLAEYGTVFMKTDEVINLPEQLEITKLVDNTTEYKRFKKDRIIEIDNKKLIGDTTLTNLLYQRQLCSIYNKNKQATLLDILESTEDRVVIFYNYKDEFELLKEIAVKLNRTYSYVNGNGQDLKNYNEYSDSITLVQYQSGATGINLQLAHQIIYYSLPLSCDLYMQSKKRIHRLGQTKTCFYYYLITKDSIEQHIYSTLQSRQDYTVYLFDKGVDCVEKGKTIL